MNNGIKNLMENVLSKIPYVGQWRKVFLKHSTPGHYYSPIPDLDYLKNNEKQIFNKDRSISSIDMNDNIQLNYLSHFKNFSHEYPYNNLEVNSRYRFTKNSNIYYTYHDACLLFSLFRALRPAIVIEVGCGFSSALMVDINENYFANKIELYSIEPFPEERFNKLIKSSDTNVHLKKQFIQDTEFEFFKQLNDGDILFIDSSHVSKVNSDLNFILFEVLPILNSGVLIHFHDVHYPFEYPKEWIYRGSFWNETYLLRAFLMYNKDFEIIFMNSFLAQKYPDKYYATFSSEADHPLDISRTGSIWLRKK